MAQIQPHKIRCFGDDENKLLLARYHGKKWRVPVHDDLQHFEMPFLAYFLPSCVAPTVKRENCLK